MPPAVDLTGLSMSAKNRRPRPRAQRFVTELQLRYRETGTVLWHGGRTENISSSGVLFRAEQALRPKTNIDLALTLPRVRPGEDSAEVLCHGVIVRAAPRRGIDSSSVLAASIGEYRFARPHRRRGGVKLPQGEGWNSATGGC